jgi:hypothetical protein
MTTFQAGTFDPVRSYDAPLVFLTQLFDDEANWQSFRRTFFEPSGLSPQERDSFASRWKDRTGRNPVTNAAIDIATNPLVWLGFLTSPAGAGAVIGQTGRLFAKSIRASQGPHILKTLGQLLRNTPGEEAVRDISKTIHDLQLDWQASVGAAQDNFSRLNGLKHHLNLDRLAVSNPGKADDMKRALWAIWGKLAGIDQNIQRADTRFVPRMFAQVRDAKGNLVREADVGETMGLDVWKKLLKDHEQLIREKGGLVGELRHGDRTFTVRSGRLREGEWASVNFGGELEERWVGSRVLDEVIDGTPGARALYESIQKATERRGIRLLLKDEVLENYDRIGRKALDGDIRELVDDQKVLRMWTGNAEVTMLGRFPGETGWMQSLLGREARIAIHQGHMTETQFLEAVRNAAGDSFRTGRYMPRNTTTWWGRTADLKSLRKRAELTGAGDNEFAVRTSYSGGRIRPLEDDAVDLAYRKLRYGEAISASGRSVPLEAFGPKWDIQSLNEFERLFGPSRKVRELKRHAVNAVDHAVAQGNPAPLKTIDPIAQLLKYQNDTAVDIATLVNAPSREVIEAQKQLFRQAIEEGRTVQVHRKAPGSFKKAAERGLLDYAVMDGNTPAPAGGWNNAWVLEQTSIMLGDRRARDLLVDTGIPYALGRMRTDHALTRYAVQSGQAMAGWLTENPFGKWLGAQGDLGRKLMHRLKYFADQPSDRFVPQVLGDTTRYLYGTHLGLNFGSVILNLQQPWLHLQGYVGAKNVALGYGDAMKIMGNYLRRRAGVAPKIDAEARRGLLREAIRDVVGPGPADDILDATGILGHAVDDLDRLAFQQTQGRRGGVLKWMVTDAPLFMFEKAEWLNRLTSIMSTRHLHAARTGLTAGEFAAARGTRYRNWLADAKVMAEETQFGSGPLNTPLLFMGRKGGGALESALANPLMRQFQTFALRAPTSFFYVGPQLGKTRTLRLPFLPEGEKLFWKGGREIPWWLGDGLRMAGMSALIYEVGKNLMGVDFSRGGFHSAMTDVFGGQRFVRGEEGLPFNAPPVASLAHGYLTGIFGGQTDLLKESIQRTVPFGIGLSRFMGILPNQKAQVHDKAMARLPSSLQRTYADWEHRSPDGKVPVYKGTGELVDFQDPIELTFRGLGVDIQRHKHAGDFDHFLSKNRDAIIQARQLYLNAIEANNISKAQRIAARFQKKFGIPLTVSRRQLKAYQRKRSIPRTERMLDRMPTEARPMYQSMAARFRAEQLAVSPQDLLEYDTAAPRPSPRIAGVHLSPEAIAELRGRLDNVEQSVDDARFTPFRGYSR